MNINCLYCNHITDIEPKKFGYEYTKDGQLEDLYFICPICKREADLWKYDKKILYFVIDLIHDYAESKALDNQIETYQEMKEDIDK